jgi:multidrug resistance efflux pump
VKRRLLWLAAPLLPAAVLVIWACGRSSTSTGDRPFVTAERRRVAVQLVEFGEIEAREVRAVLAPITGEVTWVADEGTPRKKQQPVLKMSTEDLEKRLEEDRRAGLGLDGQLKTKETVARAIARHRRAAVRLAEIDLEIARQRLAEAKSHPTAQEQSRADLDLAAARLKADRARAEEDALKDLVKQGYASDARATTARLRKVQASAELIRAEAAHREITRGRRPETIRALEVAVKKAEMTLAQARFNAEADTEVADQEVSVARTRYEVHRKRLKRIEDDIASATAPAPIDGVVALVDVWKGGSDLSPVQVGETHRRGREIMKMADISALRIRVHINERDVVLIREGQEARVRLVAHPGVVFKARVAEIAVFADDKNRQLGSLALEKSGAAGVNVVRAFLDLEVPEGAVAPRLGSSALVKIDVKVFPSALVLPIDAVQYDGEKPFAEVLRNGRVERAPLELAATTEDDAVIASGLSEDDRVLLPAGGGNGQ